METIKNALDFTDFPRIDLVIAGIVALFLLLFPLFPHSAFAMATMIQFFMFSLYGMGWNTIGGYGGQVDLGKAQYVGIGAYTTALLLIRWDIPFWFSMPIGVCLSVAWSFIIGYPLFRLKGHYFAIATIATSLVLKNLFEVWRFVGAARGLEISPIAYQPPDFLRLIFKEDVYYYYVLFVFFIIGILYINWFRKSRLGFQLRSIKDNEEMARSLGINVHWAKVKTYAIATGFVSVVGSFHACYIKAIEPEDTMSLDISILIALMAMLGGAGSLWGPIIGAGVLIPLKSYLKEWLGASAGLAGIDLVIYGLIIMIISAFEPRGIWGIVEKDPSQEKKLMARLKVDHLTKVFGGLRANADISFSVDTGELIGVIGPNGAGKTTLFNCICGLHPLTSGSVFFNDEDITELKAHEIARRGIARTFQVYAAAGDLDVLENVMVGCFLRTRSRSGAKQRAAEILEEFNLTELRHSQVSELTVAAQKRVTMATALATDPKLLLLDEVAAGLNPSEVEGVMDNIRHLNQDLGITVLLIEHVMELVMNISQRVIVIDYGQKIAEGEPHEVVKDPLVIKAYLGERYVKEHGAEEIA